MTAILPPPYAYVVLRADPPRALGVCTIAPVTLGVVPFLRCTDLRGQVRDVHPEALHHLMPVSASDAHAARSR